MKRRMLGTSGGRISRLGGSLGWDAETRGVLWDGECGKAVYEGNGGTLNLQPNDWTTGYRMGAITNQRCNHGRIEP